MLRHGRETTTVRPDVAALMSTGVGRTPECMEPLPQAANDNQVCKLRPTNWAAFEWAAFKLLLIALWIVLFFARLLTVGPRGRWKAFVRRDF
jgi:hypothetical protein